MIRQIKRGLFSIFNASSTLHQSMKANSGPQIAAAKGGTTQSPGRSPAARSPASNSGTKPKSSPKPAASGNAGGTSKGTTPKKPATGKPAKPARKVIGEDKFPGLSLQSKTKRPVRTGFMYDEAMLDYKSLHDENFIEAPERISYTYDKCRTQGLVKRCIRLKVAPCSDEDLLSVHDADYVEKMKSSSQMSKEDLISMEHGYDAVCFHQNSMKCARLSAGATIEMLKAVVSDQITNGLAVIRPPGHHATKEGGCGHCYFNNVAIATKHCLDKLGLAKVLIVDWDVHHGQSTQRMFYNDPRVLYISIHRYEHGWFWPNLRESDYDYIGEKKGLGYNVNIPLNKTGMTDGDYLAIFHQIIMPLAMEFNPDAVIVSAGYDCALGCPEGEMKVSPPLFSHLVHMLKSLADGRLALILEGGYHLESLSEGVAYSLRALLDDSCPLIGPSLPPQPEMVNVILNCINQLRPYWKCFLYQNTNYCEKAVNLASADPRGEAPLILEDPAYYELFKYDAQPKEKKDAFTEEIKEIVKAHPTRTTQHRTSYVYDDHMMEHKNVLEPSHPEKPERISWIRDMLEEYGLLKKCIKLASRRATREELNLVHDLKHIERIKELETTKPREYPAIEATLNSIYIHPKSYSCALMAAGSLLNVVDSVMTDETRNGFAIIRPPGHHAEADIPCGFCFFNNVPIAAKYAQKKYSAKKIMIMDWDVHHGNGTQHMFESDDSVLYISLHRYDNGFFYPGSADANYDKVGKGKGEGFNVNIPFNSKVSPFYYLVNSGPPEGVPGDAEYIAAFQQIVMPICYEYAPDLIFISAGFDAAKDDPLGGYRITPGGYAHMTHMLTSLANGRVILALEGGYNLNSISESFSACVDVMLGGTPPRIQDTEPAANAVETIKNVISVHKKYWKSLCCDVTLPYNETEILELKKEKPEETKEKEKKVPSDLDDLGAKLKAMMLELKGSDSETPPTEGSADAPPSASDTAQSAAPSKPSDDDITQLGAAAAVPSPADQGATELFAVTPLSWCAHLEDNQPLTQDLDISVPCMECGHVGENWVCLTCYKVYCSRYVNEHMLFHSIETEHKMVLSYSDLSTWCYGCDSYVHNIELLPMKDSAYRSKFGRPLEGGY